MKLFCLLWLRYVDGISLSRWDVASASLALTDTAIIMLQPHHQSRPLQKVALIGSLASDESTPHSAETLGTVHRLRRLFMSC